MTMTPEQIAAPELLPCPFCGDKMVLWDFNTHARHQNPEANCPVRHQAFRLDLWNMRAADTQLLTEIERLNAQSLKNSTQYLALVGQAQDALEAERAKVAKLVEGLKPFAFTDFETAQQAWECIYKDDLRAWVDFCDIEIARAILASIKETPHE